MNKFLKRFVRELTDSVKRLVAKDEYGCRQLWIGCALSGYSIATAVKKLDLSEELAEIIRTDNVALLNRVGAAGLVRNDTPLP